MKTKKKLEEEEFKARTFKKEEDTDMHIYFKSPRAQSNGKENVVQEYIARKAQIAINNV